LQVTTKKASVFFFVLLVVVGLFPAAKQVKAFVISFSRSVMPDLQLGVLFVTVLEKKRHSFSVFFLMPA